MYTSNMWLVYCTNLIICGTDTLDKHIYNPDPVTSQWAIPKLFCVPNLAFCPSYLSLVECGNKHRETIPKQPLPPLPTGFWFDLAAVICSTCHKCGSARLILDLFCAQPFSSSLNTANTNGKGLGWRMQISLSVVWVSRTGTESQGPIDSRNCLFTQTSIPSYMRYCINVVIWRSFLLADSGTLMTASGKVAIPSHPPAITEVIVIMLFIHFIYSLHFLLGLKVDYKIQKQCC